MSSKKEKIQLVSSTVILCIVFIVMLPHSDIYARSRILAGSTFSCSFTMPLFP